MLLSIPRDLIRRLTALAQRVNAKRLILHILQHPRWRLRNIIQECVSHLCILYLLLGGAISGWENLLLIILRLALFNWF